MQTELATRLSTTATTHKTIRPRKYTPRKIIGYVLVYALLTAIALVFMIPLLWMFSTSLKTRGEVFAWPPTWLPNTPHWENYSNAFSKYPLGRFMLNSAFLVAMNIIGHLVSVPIIAYGFARLRFPGKSIAFVLMLSTLMIPTQIKLIPMYSMYSRLGMINTYWPLTLPSFFGDAFFIFLLIQYMRTIPKDLDEAARIDGAGTWTILYRVLLPLCIPPLTVMTVFTFLWTWNEFLQPIIYLNNFDSYPISVGLAFFRGGRYGVEWNLLMAATLVSLAPILILYFFAQKHLIGGIATVGLKG